MESNTQLKGIRSWAEDDRPREKLLIKGRSALSNAELIAILIGSGSINETAVDLAKRILNNSNNRLTDLAKLSIPDLTKFKGIGNAKAISLIASLELGKRSSYEQKEKTQKITGSYSAFKAIYPNLSDLKHEEFWVLYINKAGEIITKENISKGGISETIVDSKVIFKFAIQHLCSGIILCHNHPSGNLKPSKADLELTNRIKKAGLTLDILTLDHLIIGQHNYFSFLDEGIL